MQYRTDKKSGNKLSVLGFGCMRFPRSAELTEKLIVDAVAHGVNYFDTAYMYGASEETLGGILAKNNLREKVYIATKLPLFFIRSAKDFDKFFNKELERLKTDYIDYYLMHMITDLAQWQYLCSLGIENWIKEKKESGAIKQIGFSFHGVRDEFLSVLDAYDWEMCQIQYNYSDENFQAGVTGLKKAAEKNIPVIIMEPLLGGKLASGLPPKAIDIFKSANPDLSPAAWALRWLWNQPEVTSAISGMGEASQLADNLHTAENASVGMLTDQEQETFAAVAEIFREYNNVPCTGCGYCLPCPRHINIPACFSAYNTSYIMGRRTGFQQYRTSTGPISAQESRAGLCIQCRKCESHCPQGIEISRSLRDVKKRLEPWWYAAGIGVARAFIVKKKGN